MIPHTRARAAFAGILWMLLSLGSPAQSEDPAPIAPAKEGAEAQAAPAASTIDTLASFVDLRTAIMRDIKAVNQQIGASQSDAEKENLKLQVDKLESEMG